MSRDSFNPSNSENTSNLSDTISDAKNRAAELASKLKDKASQLTSTVSDTVGRQRDNVAGGLDRAASTIHEKAGSLPGAGQKAADAANRLADGMESTASYLRDHDLKGMGNDVAGICRKYPLQSLLSAVAIGFLVGRSLRK
jgi:hypothetical protein